MTDQALDGHPFDDLLAMPDEARARRRLDVQRDPLSGEILSHIVGVVVDLHASIPFDRPSIVFAGNRLHPTVRIDLLGQARARRQFRIGHCGWPIATDHRLVGPLIVVVLGETGDRFSGRFQ